MLGVHTEVMPAAEPEWLVVNRELWDGMAGLMVELFHEFDVTPWLERGDDRLFYFRPDVLRFPLTYSLRARRP